MRRERRLASERAPGYAVSPMGDEIYIDDTVRSICAPVCSDTVRGYRRARRWRTGPRHGRATAYIAAR